MALIKNFINDDGNTGTFWILSKVEAPIFEQDAWSNGALCFDLYRDVLAYTVEHRTPMRSFRITVPNDFFMGMTLVADPWLVKRVIYERHAYIPGLEDATPDFQVSDIATKVDTTHLVLLGHSSGSVLALLFAQDWLIKGLAIEEIFLLACPKAPTQLLVDFIQQKVLRLYSFLNGKDFVRCLIPGLKRPRTLKIGKSAWWKFCSFNEHFIEDIPKTQGYAGALIDLFHEKFVNPFFTHPSILLFDHTSQ